MIRNRREAIVCGTASKLSARVRPTRYPRSWSARGPVDSRRAGHWLPPWFAAEVTAILTPMLNHEVTRTPGRGRVVVATCQFPVDAEIARNLRFIRRQMRQAAARGQTASASCDRTGSTRPTAASTDQGIQL